LENWHGDSLERFSLLFFSQGKKKKEDEVNNEDDDDVARTSVSQDRATATLCTEGLFLSTQYIQVSPHIRRSTIRGGGEYGQSTRHIRGPSWVSHPPSWNSLWVTEFLIKRDIFGQLFCDLCKTINLFFLFLSIQSQFPHQKELVISDFV
jgi:hypothetical protein